MVHQRLFATALIIIDIQIICIHKGFNEYILKTCKKHYEAHMGKHLYH